MEILKKMNDIFADVLDDESIVIDENSTANDIEDWDSVTHIQLVIAIERAFNIKLTSQEIRNFNNVGDMVKLIGEKTA